MEKDYIFSEDGLTPVEKSFRRLYRNHPECHLEIPHTTEQLSLLLKGFDSSETAFSAHMKPELSETMFIAEDMDVGLVSHLRYMPASWHKHVFFELIYVISGEGENYLPELTLHMKPGDLFIMSPESTHALSVFSDDTRITNLLIRTTTFSTVFSELFQGQNILGKFFHRALRDLTGDSCLLFHTGDNEELRECYRKICRAYKDRRRFRREITNQLVYIFLLVLMRDAENTMEIISGADVKNFSETLYILQYMQRHFLTISLNDLAAFFNYSPRPVERIVRAATGRSFRENIQKQKIDCAKRLLISTELPVERICTECGYGSQSSFRKIFMRDTGCLPSEYRRMHRRR